MFVPWVSVIGRSVFGRTVRHGTPKNVVSSCTPPESVMTSPAESMRLSIAKYGIGSIKRTPPSRRVRSHCLSCSRERGCTGNTTWRRACTSASESQSSLRTAGLSTFDGRCSVTRTKEPARRSNAWWVSKDLAAGSARTSVSIRTLPTKAIRSRLIPSRSRLAMASREGANSKSAR